MVILVLMFEYQVLRLMSLAEKKVMKNNQYDGKSFSLNTNVSNRGISVAFCTFETLNPF